ncbi:MAG TPA: hypothetical protein PLZ93_09290 [Nocardioides sp.]|uniref:hypothetical protein n=1 Tax=uncultured Nocardioides sp. TaxID=198441 RepID=UPI002631FE83|nr:hypothetical protein [uncultured Nocardioides sp.]HRD61771.1 hypothetical protein [Nocardioides sp.]HRI95795.1 hypothetical protein [Nocardioides sp.]HRK47612.1 hypothetical protein [Nocardioides sp.]
MRVRSLVLFGAGYVLGSRAGRERYAHIVEVAGKAAQRLRESDLARDLATNLADNATEPTVRLADYLQNAASSGSRRPS